MEENLGKKGLKVNKNKPANCITSRQNHQWKKCKLLVTLLDTEEDIKKTKDSCDKCRQQSTPLLRERQIDNQLKTETDQHVH